MFEDDLNPQATGYHEMRGRGSEVRDLWRLIGIYEHMRVISD
jgi:hypothetical protein